MAVWNQVQQGVLRSRAKQREVTSFWVTTREAFWIAIETLRTHKLRSFLTLLG